jgi:hypothetical protein
MHGFSSSGSGIGNQAAERRLQEVAIWVARRSIEGEALKIQLTATDLPYVERVGLCGSCGDLLISKNPDTLLCQGCCCRLIVTARFEEELR